MGALNARHTERTFTLRNAVSVPVGAIGSRRPKGMGYATKCAGLVVFSNIGRARFNALAVGLLLVSEAWFADQFAFHVIDMCNFLAHWGSFQLAVFEMIGVVGTSYIATIRLGSCTFASTNAFTFGLAFVDKTRFVEQFAATIFRGDESYALCFLSH